MSPGKTTPDPQRLDRLVADARRSQAQRETTYRERALKIYPWICGRCAREFAGSTLRMLTVHHRDHNHDNNPPDGSNWELLCLYCHDNEHSRQLEFAAGGAARGAAGGTAKGAAGGTGKDAPGSAASGAGAAGYKAFAGLESLLKVKK